MVTLTEKDVHILDAMLETLLKDGRIHSKRMNLLESLQDQQKEQTRKQEISDLELSKLRSDAKLSKWQVKTFWWFFLLLLSALFLE